MIALLPLSLLVLATPYGLPDQTIDFAVTNARAVNVYSALAKNVGRPIDASCLADQKLTLSVTGAPLPVLFEVLAARLGVTYRDTFGGIVVDCPPPKAKPKGAAVVGGALAVEVPAAVRQFLTQGKDVGLMVREASVGLPSWISGIRAGDFLVEADGVLLTDAPTLAKLVAKKRGDVQSMEFLIVRGGESIRLAVVLKNQPPVALRSAQQLQQNAADAARQNPDESMKIHGTKTRTNP